MFKFISANDLDNIYWVSIGFDGFLKCAVVSVILKWVKFYKKKILLDIFYNIFIINT